MLTFIFQELMPGGYIYKINNLEILGNNQLKTKFEIPDCSETIFRNWLSELSQKSQVSYRVKSFTKSPSPKIVFNVIIKVIFFLKLILIFELLIIIFRKFIDVNIIHFRINTVILIQSIQDVPPH